MISVSGLCIVMKTYATNKEKTNCVICCIFENMLQIFSFSLSPWPLGFFCPDNDPGWPQLPEIPLFF